MSLYICTCGSCMRYREDMLGYTGTCRPCIVHRHMYFMLSAQINVGHVWYTVPCSSCLGGKSFLFFYFHFKETSIKKYSPSSETGQVYFFMCYIKKFMIKIKTMDIEFILFTGYMYKMLAKFLANSSCYFNIFLKRIVICLTKFCSSNI